MIIITYFSYSAGRLLHHTIFGNEPTKYYQEVWFFFSLKSLVIFISSLSPHVILFLIKHMYWMIHRMVFYAAFNIIQRWQLALFMSFLGFTSVLPNFLPNFTDDPMRLALRNLRLRVKHFTTEPRRSP